MSYCRGLGNQPAYGYTVPTKPAVTWPQQVKPAPRKGAVRVTRLRRSFLTPAPRFAGPVFEQQLPFAGPIVSRVPAPTMGELAFSLKPPKWIRKMKPLKAIARVVSVAAPFVPIIGPVLKPLVGVVSRLPGVATVARLATAPVRTVSSTVARLTRPSTLPPGAQNFLRDRLRARLTPGQATAVEQAVQPVTEAAVATLPSGEMVQAPVMEFPSDGTMPAPASRDLTLPLMLGAGVVALMLLGKGKR